jgi:hypothetical protein
MAMQFGVATRNARLDQIETVLGTGAVMTIRTGAQPANCAAANAGTVLATVPLPADWLQAAANGQKLINNGPWQDLTADAGGLAAHFRIHTSGGVCEQQGSVGQGTGDLQLDNTTLVAGQLVQITGYTLTDGNQ